VREQALAGRSSAEVAELQERVRVLEGLVRDRDAELVATRAALAEAQAATAVQDTRREDFAARIRELSAAVVEMRTRLHETAADFERRLAEERTRREAAEAALAALSQAPAPSAPEAPAAPEAPSASEPSGDDALEALIAGLREQVDSAREQLRAWDTEPAPPAAPEPPVAPEPPAASAEDAARERLRAIEADLRARVPDPEAALPAREVIAGLQDAADRLRAAAQEELSRIEEVEQPAEPPEAEAPAEETPPAEAPPTAVTLGARPVDFGARESAWLRSAIERLADGDPVRAAELFVALLPSQASVGVQLSYVLTAPTLGAVKVAVRPGAVDIERPPTSSLADARISGALQTLAPMVAGGGAWRAPGVRIEGAKRPARKLLRRRRPLGLGDFALLADPPAPGLVLAALAAAVDPTWTAGHRFGVQYDLADGGRFTITASDGEPLRLSEGEQPHAALVTVPENAVLPMLQGASTAATVAGDRRAVDVLHGWFDRARGVSAG
jgi:hypothetical protein